MTLHSQTANGTEKEEKSMKATVKIEKSFDKGVAEFSKTNTKSGDLRTFFDDEGEYLERLNETLRKHGKTGDSFTVVYTVTITK